MQHLQPNLKTFTKFSQTNLQQFIFLQSIPIFGQLFGVFIWKQRNMEQLTRDTKSYSSYECICIDNLCYVYLLYATLKVWNKVWSWLRMFKVKVNASGDPFRLGPRYTKLCPFVLCISIKLLNFDLQLDTLSDRLWVQKIQ